MVDLSIIAADRRIAVLSIGLYHNSIPGVILWAIRQLTKEVKSMGGTLSQLIRGPRSC